MAQSSFIALISTAPLAFGQLFHFVSFNGAQSQAE
jgi:hypothetical protein